MPESDRAVGLYAAGVTIRRSILRSFKLTAERLDPTTRLSRFEKKFDFENSAIPKIASNTWALETRSRFCSSIAKTIDSNME